MDTTTDSTGGRFTGLATPPVISGRVIAWLRRRRPSRSGICSGRLTVEEFAVFKALFESSSLAAESADVVVLFCPSSGDAERAEARCVEIRHRHADVIVVVPCGVEPPATATQHYAITPGSERALLYGMANILIASGWVPSGSIAAHAVGFEEFASLITWFTTDRVSSATSLCADDLWYFAQTIADGKRVSLQWKAARARATRVTAPGRRALPPIG